MQCGSTRYGSNIVFSNHSHASNMVLIIWQSFSLVKLFLSTFTSLEYYFDYARINVFYKNLFLLLSFMLRLFASFLRTLHSKLFFSIIFLSIKGFFKLGT